MTHCAVWPPGRVRRVLVAGLVVVAMSATSAYAGETRDVVFECPCRADWVADDESGESGELTLKFGIRNHRASESGEMRMEVPEYFEIDGTVYVVGTDPTEWSGLGVIPPNTVVDKEIRVEDYGRIVPSLPFTVGLHERLAEAPVAVETANARLPWHLLEWMSLWANAEDASSDRVRLVDIQTDSDADGVGDVNELMAGTSPTARMEGPSASEIDILVAYDSEFRRHNGQYPLTYIHHLMTATGAVFEDNDTNVRLRTIAVRETEWGDNGLAVDSEELLESGGGDVLLQFHGVGPWPCPSGSAGCASLGGSKDRGAWVVGKYSAWAAVFGRAGVMTVAHELGHVMGLAHSALQGEANGAFRWSRGHYYGRNGEGTIMSYSAAPRVARFSRPGVDCGRFECGVSPDRPEGADAVASLDLVRFQVAGHRSARADTDGDGFVDELDGFPEDANEWTDADGDGQGDNADADDDGDGVEDALDKFPLDASEWEDVDGDGVGDNGDDDVLDLAPFQDPGLRSAVEEALGKQSGEPVSGEEVATLTVLDASRRGIRNLAGLELASNLGELDVSGNAIDDMSPLAGLTNLSGLEVGDNHITDLSPLKTLTQLEALSARGNSVVDLSALAGLSALTYLGLSSNAISDLSPLAGLSGLKSLWLLRNEISDLSPLAGLTELSVLDVDGNDVSELAPLAGLTALWSLHVSENRVADLSPLSGLTNLYRLRVGGNNEVSDVSPIANAPGLRDLGVGGTDVTLEDVAALPYFRDLQWLDASGLGIEDLSPLSGMTGPEYLGLSGNEITDVSPLAGLTGLRTLDLDANSVSDVGPLAKQSLWRVEGGSLFLYGNPLDETSVEEHVPLLQSWGVRVGYSFPLPDEVHIPDQALRSLVAEALANAFLGVDSPITAGNMGRLTGLSGQGAGVADLTGLDAAAALSFLYMGSNAIVDLEPLGDLGGLSGLDLASNSVVDITPLVDNAAFGEGDWLNLSGNPLRDLALNEHVPALIERGVEVRLDAVRIDAVPGEAVRFGVNGYFAALLGAGVGFSVESSDPAVAGVEVTDGGVVTVTPADAPGTVVVTVTATGADGKTAVLSFDVSLEEREQSALAVWLFPAASDAMREGFVRVVNHAQSPVAVTIDAFDDLGMRAGPVTLSIGGRRTVHFNSTDLEQGNAAKGLPGGLGSGMGDWRLVLNSSGDVEVLAYVRTADGFVTSMHDTVPLAEDGSSRVAFFNPGSNLDQVSHLRLVNAGSEDAEASVSGMDDSGRSSGGAVRVPIAAGASVTLAAGELESGMGLDGALGDGSGKWRLAMTSDRPLIAMSLLESPTGHLTNLSTVPTGLTSEEGVHTVPLFLSGSDPLGRQGFVRVENLSDVAGTVRIDAFDDTDRAYERVTLTLAAHEVRPFNSDDIELGNVSKGLAGSTGSGEGDWRLELSSDLEIDVLAYIRTQDGFLTSMHELAPSRDNAQRVAFFNPGSNVQQVSTLRLTNRGDGSTTATITGVDDAGALGGLVFVVVPAGRTVELTAAQLEQGGDDGVEGQLGDGVGKWRLQVESNGPLTVMSVLESPTGHLANLSTAPGRGALTGPAASDVADSSIPDPALRYVVRRALGKGPGVPISAGDMATLTILDAEDSGIEELAGLELATGLTELLLRSNAVSDLSPLAGLGRLEKLDVSGNEVLDLSPLKGLTALETLDVSWNGAFRPGDRLSDLSALAGLANLHTLRIGGNEISDLRPLEGLANLHTLWIGGNEISDLRPLEGLTRLGTLGASFNKIEDLAPLSGLTGLRHLFLTHNSVGDLSPLSTLALQGLGVGYNDVALADVLGLPYYGGLRILGVQALGIEDIAALSELSRIQYLYLGWNSITDVSPLAGLVGLRYLSLGGNAVSDIAPLVARPIWESAYSPIDQSTLWLRGNPLSPESLDEHVPQLRSWGVKVFTD